MTSQTVDMWSAVS